MYTNVLITLTTIHKKLKSKCDHHTKVHHTNMLNIWHLFPFIIACNKPTYLKKTLQISWDIRFRFKFKEADVIRNVHHFSFSFS